MDKVLYDVTEVYENEFVEAIQFSRNSGVVMIGRWGFWPILRCYWKGSRFLFKPKLRMKSMRKSMRCAMQLVYQLSFFVWLSVSIRTLSFSLLSPKSTVPWFFPIFFDLAWACGQKHTASDVVNSFSNFIVIDTFYFNLLWERTHDFARLNKQMVVILKFY